MKFFDGVAGGGALASLWQRAVAGLKLTAFVAIIVLAGAELSRDLNEVLRASAISDNGRTAQGDAPLPPKAFDELTLKLLEREARLRQRALELQRLECPRSRLWEAE
jgi:hypothetical protein